MGTLTRQATIAAPIAHIFQFTSDPHNAPRYISSITEILSGPKGKVRTGEKWQAHAHFLGRPTTITLNLLELHAPHRIVFALEGDPEAVLTVRLVQEDRSPHTLVSLTLEVPSVPTILLQGFMGGLLAEDMKRLKSLMES